MLSFDVPARATSQESVRRAPVSLKTKRLLTFATVILAAAAAGYFVPGMFLRWLLTGEAF